jgi:hypothetical protein
MAEQREDIPSARGRLTGSILLIVGITSLLLGSYLWVSRQRNPEFPDPCEDRVSRTVEINFATLAPEAATTSSSGSTSSPPLMIEVSWPTRIESGKSNWVRVSLGSSLVDSCETPPATKPELEPPLPLGTFDLPLDELHGPGYQAFAVANLTGTGFEIQPVMLDYQPLQQVRGTWVWNLSSSKRGWQHVNANIQLQWTARPGEDASSAETIYGQMWESPLPIYVQEPWLDSGKATSIVKNTSTIVGMLLSIFGFFKLEGDQFLKRAFRQLRTPS